MGHENTEAKTIAEEQLKIPVDLSTLEYLKGKNRVSES
jgi:hypothetical protein